MLTRFDEYLIHQTPEPLAHPVSMDRNIYDRYWLGGFKADASLYFAMSLGLYPNRQVMDAGFSVVRGGEQVAFFGSRRADLSERDNTRVGPLALQVIEPMRRLRLHLAANDSGLAADLEFQAHSACVEEDRQILKRGATTWMDVTRFTQFGRWQGWLQVDGERIDIHAADVHGIRDRSWGRRNVGEGDAGAPAPAPQVYFLWAPLIWDDHASLAVFFEDAQGQALHAEAKTVPVYADAADAPPLHDPGQRQLNGAARQVCYVPGTRRASAATLRLLGGEGELHEVTLEPLLRHQMKGTGYHHPTWRHGCWHGELALGADRWRLDQLDPLALDNLHIQQLVRCRQGERTGIGVLEQLCIGPHAPSGFTGLRDGAA